MFVRSSKQLFAQLLTPDFQQYRSMGLYPSVSVVGESFQDRPFLGADAGCKEKQEKEQAEVVMTHLKERYFQERESPANRGEA
jgi:hypothetical protein